MSKSKYITQTIELTNPLDDLNLLIDDKTTELTVNFNYEDKKKALNLSNFNNLKKLTVINKIYLEQKKINYAKKIDISSSEIELEISSSSITKINCVGSNINCINFLPANLTHLKCSDNNIQIIKNLPKTLKVLDLSNCNLEKNEIDLCQFSLCNLEVLKLNRNSLCDFLKQNIHILYNKLKVFECVNNNLCDLDTVMSFMKNLEVLNCKNNLLNELNNLPPGLKILNCSHNLIINLDNLPFELEILDCSFNKLVNLDYLPSGIIKLNCSHNDLVCLDNLPNTIKHLIIISTKITQIENLPLELTNLKVIRCENFKNKVENLPKSLENVIMLYNSDYFYEHDLKKKHYYYLKKLPNIKSAIVSVQYPRKKTINLIK